ncbi:MAG: hypothetical protein LBF68_08020 [Christensenellaceae bacterium]|jgi:hypothetical protein|nr:hypothetical protein [Christensenellaceae bacterium]
MNSENAQEQIDISIKDKNIIGYLSQLSNDNCDNVNNLINNAVYLGLQELCYKKFGNYSESVVKKSMKELESLKMTIDQNAVSLSMCERLLTVLYNLEATKMGGLEVTSEQLEDGTLDQLPKYLVAEKNAMLTAEFLNKWRNR